MTRSASRDPDWVGLAEARRDRPGSRDRPGLDAVRGRRQRSGCASAHLEADPPTPHWHRTYEFYPPAWTAHQLKVRASVETVAGLSVNDTMPEKSAATLESIVVAERVEWPPIDIVHVNTLVR